MSALVKTVNLLLDRLLLGSMDLDAKFASNADILDRVIGKVYSATYDPASLATGAGATTTIPATGAVLGDFVSGVSFSLDTQGISLSAWVSAPDVVSVRFQNATGGTIDLASGTLSVRVAKKA